MQLKLNTKTLTEIKEFSPFKEIAHFKTYTREEMQQILIVMAFIDFAKTKGLISHKLEVLLEHK